jgi:hypothetical protein
MELSELSPEELTGGGTPVVPSLEGMTGGGTLVPSPAEMTGAETPEEMMGGETSVVLLS